MKRTWVFGYPFLVREFLKITFFFLRFLQIIRWLKKWFEPFEHLWFQRKDTWNEISERSSKQKLHALKILKPKKGKEGDCLALYIMANYNYSVNCIHWLLMGKKRNFQREREREMPSKFPPTTDRAASEVVAVVVKVWRNVMREAKAKGAFWNLTVYILTSYYLLLTLAARIWRPAYLTSQLNSVIAQPIPPKQWALLITYLK